MAQTPRQYKVANNEVWNYNREEFLFVAIILTDGCEYYFSKSPNRKLPEDADLALLAARAIHIPRAYYQPPPPLGLLIHASR